MSFDTLLKQRFGVFRSKVWKMKHANDNLLGSEVSHNCFLRIRNALGAILVKALVANILGNLKLSGVIQTLQRASDYQYFLQKKGVSSLGIQTGFSGCFFAGGVKMVSIATCKSLLAPLVIDLLTTCN